MGAALPGVLVTLTEFNLQKLGLFKKGTPHPTAYYPANMYLGTFEVILFT